MQYQNNLFSKILLYRSIEQSMSFHNKQMLQSASLGLINFLVPLIPLLFSPYNQTATIGNILKEEPVLNQFLLLEPSMSGCDFSNYCKTMIHWLILCFFFFIGPFFIFYVGILFVYFKKTYSLSKTKFFSHQTQKLNFMLWRVISLQLYFFFVILFAPTGGLLIAQGVLLVFPNVKLFQVNYILPFYILLIYVSVLPHYQRGYVFRNE